MPQFSSILLRMWERVSSFIVRAGTVIFISSIIIWAGSSFGWVNGSLAFSTEMAMTKLAAFSFLVFNLLCAPCFAAIGAMKREMNNAKWTAFALAYQTFFAYVVSLVIYQFGSAYQGQAHPVGLTVAALILAGMVYMLFRPYPEEQRLSVPVKV